MAGDDHIRDTHPDRVALTLAPVASGKSLLQRVEDRGRWPGVRQRYCTSEMKSGPIASELCRYRRAHPRFGGLIVNAMELRHDESAERARHASWKRNQHNSRAGGPRIQGLVQRKITVETFMDLKRNNQDMTSGVDSMPAAACYRIFRYGVAIAR